MNLEPPKSLRLRKRLLTDDGLRSHPYVPLSTHEFVVFQFRIGATDPVNLLLLAGTEGFLRIQAPNAFKQTLSPQYFMQTSDAAREVVCCIEKRGIAIGHARAF